MPQVIENPILNRPYERPERHFAFDDDGITSEVVQGRRRSAYFVPIARTKRRSGEQLPMEYTADRVEENDTVNQVRGRVDLWRDKGWPGVTPTTRWLLRFWSAAERERRLFFCQIEALETLIWLAEVAPRAGHSWLDDELRQHTADYNPGLYRVACKMATGSGKTVVMAMIIAWQALNKFASRYDKRFTDAFLIVTPGITIRDRLAVLRPSAPDNYYRERDLLPADRIAELGAARIALTNFHAFQRRERGDGAALTKRVLGADRTGAFTESPAQMVRRVCRDLGPRRGIVVLNDEAHHCYRPREGDAQAAVLAAEERTEAARYTAEARVWAGGLEAVAATIGVRNVYDLSATPFFLRGSGWPEGKLFPWVVSDFSLIDAIESGIVKIPRVPVSDDAGGGDQPAYRDLWTRIRDQLPKAGRRTAAVTGEPRLPAELQGALHSLYGDYEQSHRAWRDDEQAQASGSPPPVFIVVCSNTNVSKMVFDYVAGWERTAPDGSALAVPGRLPLFSNVADGRWTPRPPTILVDSQQLESGEAMSAAFKRIAARQIAEFAHDLALRYPGRSADDLTDEDLLREVLNTVGKPGKLGADVTCVVSVSMLTEGWDANTVTHVLGVRAFGTQLLCEQVVGRGLRRRSYAVEADGRFAPEYAEVYGVPFSFIPTSAKTPAPTAARRVVRVRALPERADRELRFPKVEGYRLDLGDAPLLASFAEESRLRLTAGDVPTTTEMEPIVGLPSVHDLSGLRRERVQSIAFVLAQRLLEKYFTDGEDRRPWRFPELLRIARHWLDECVDLGDGAFVQLLALHERRDEAVDRIYRAIAAPRDGTSRMVPILRAYDATGSTRWVDFDTSREVYVTAAGKCHVSHVTLDSGWEAEVAHALEAMDDVLAYIKNDHLGLEVPYTHGGQPHVFLPDFLVRLDDGRGPEDPLNVLLEVTGRPRPAKSAKVATARTLWVPAMNAHGGYGRWSFVEVTDPEDVQRTIRERVPTAEVATRALQGLPVDEMVAIARRYDVVELAVFGSVLRADFRPDSDIDVLVEFDPARPGGVFRFLRLQDELTDLVGRPVDLSYKETLRPRVRDEILTTRRVVYAAA